AGPAELIGKSITTFVHPADRAMLRERAERRQRGEDVPSVYEYRIVRPSGEERTVEISATAILYDEQSASLAIVRDITERKRAEAEVAEVNRRLTGALMDLETAQQRLVQQERLRALGEMAAGIAHDLNNALSPVVGFSDLLLSAPHALTDPDRVQTYLGLIRTGAQDAAGVVARLREFYRPREGGDVLVPVDLAVIVEQAVALTAPKWKDQAQSLGRTIHVETDLAPVSPAAGVEAELRELLTNLIFNAADALPRGGTVTVRTRQRDGQGVLEVAGTGTGMDEETRRRCLEPFFSTKGEKGTGLGLSMVHGTVRRHKGEIEIESAPGRGTIFRIVLPLWGARELEVAIPVAETAVARPLSVLVMDDEPSVRQVTMAFLKHDGHRVECAADGYEALRILRTRPADLVVTDRAMPGMSGEHLATMVKEIWPATAIVLLTGFGDLMDAAGEHPRAIDAVLGKPVTMVKLRETVARVVAAGLQDKDAQETPALAQLAEAAAH
ncbi:MAG TPA: ATP-binding protein, partial [Chloroflexota bacterium]|nr:ATP-binding protein [Chloroflexota bacterium]